MLRKPTLLFLRRMTQRFSHTVTIAFALSFFLVLNFAYASRDNVRAYGRLAIAAPSGWVPQDGTFSLPVAKVGAAYEFQFQTEGGLAPLKWIVASGSLPPGLRLDEQGKLSGTPAQAKAEAYAFVVEVGDSARPPQRFPLPCLLMVQAAPLRIVTKAASPLRIVTTPNNPLLVSTATRVAEPAPTPQAVPASANRSVAPTPPAADGLRADLSDTPLFAPAPPVGAVVPNFSVRKAMASLVGSVDDLALGMKCSTDNRRLLEKLSPEEKAAKLDIIEDYHERCDASLVGLAFGGVVLSQQAQNFSQSDPFGGFTMGYRSGQYGRLLSPIKSHLNFRFQGLFSAEARSTTAPTLPELKDKFLFTDQAFLSSRKVFNIEAQLWTEKHVGRHLSFGPYFAWGGSTVLDKNEVQGESVTVDATTKDKQTAAAQLDTSKAKTDNDMKQYKEAGAMLNLYLLDNGNNKNKNPLFAQAILAYGNYEALKGLVPKDRFPFAKDTQHRFIGKLRVFPLGLKRNFENDTIEHGPMFGVVRWSRFRGHATLLTFSPLFVC